MIPNSKQLLEMAHCDWKNREERRGIHAEQPFVAGWITGYLSALPDMVEGVNGKIIPRNEDHFMNPDSKHFYPDAAAHDPDSESHA